MQQINTVLLDIGNVLIFHDNRLLFGRLGQRVGLSSERVEALLLGDLWDAIHRGNLDAEGIRHQVCRALGTEIGSEEFDQLWSCHLQLNEAVLPQVEALVGRVKLGALSNTNALHARYFQRKLPILRKFDQVLLSHELHLMKPEPAIFLEALRRLDSPPEVTAFFDDIPEYVEAAQSLGLRGRIFHSAAEFRSQLLSLRL